MPKLDKTYEPPKRTQVWGKENKWEELEISGPVRNISPKLWQFTHLTALFLSGNHLSRLPPDISRLHNLVHLDISGNKLRSLPVELGDMVQLRELLLNDNMLRALPYELGRLFHLQVLGISGNPLSPDLLSMTSEHSGTTRLVSWLLDNLQMDPRPPDREWIDLNPQTMDHHRVRFTIMCYNILSDRYATRQVYGYCPSWALGWEYRKGQLLKEIVENMADLVALQEVETEQFYNFFHPELSQHGYDGIFQPKSRARTMDEHERKYVDGCAIFYHKSKFQFVDQYLVEFNQLAMANAHGSSDMLNRVMLRDNIGLSTLLQIKDPSISENSDGQPQHILVSNAHIHWDPEYRDVKLIQMVMLMSELDRIVSTIQQDRGIGKGSKPGIPLILCGDFNSLPDSSVVEYLTNAQIPVSHPDLQEFSYDGFISQIAATSPDKKELVHHFSIKSAYMPDQISYSNYTYDFKGIIDYIFYSSEFLHLQGLLGPVNKEWFQQWRVLGCPNPHYPSDHFPLLSQLELMTST